MYTRPARDFTRLSMKLTPIDKEKKKNSAPDKITKKVKRFYWWGGGQGEGV